MHLKESITTKLNMHWARKLICIFFATATVVAIGDDISSKPRKIEINGGEDSPIVVDFTMTGSEVVLTGTLVDGRLSPLEGYVFGDNSLQDGMRLRLQITPPDKKPKKDHWDLWYGVVDKESGVGSKLSLAAVKGEIRLPATSITVPVQAENVETYLIPFRTVAGKSECIFVGIAKDKSLLKETFHVLPRLNFDWDSSFRPASTPMHPAKE